MTQEKGRNKPEESLGNLERAIRSEEDFCVAG
jgi:hypothetical protein